MASAWSSIPASTTGWWPPSYGSHRTPHSVRPMRSMRRRSREAAQPSALGGASAMRCRSILDEERRRARRRRVSAGHASALIRAPHSKFKARTAIAWLRAKNPPQSRGRFELETPCSEFIRKELELPQRPLATSTLNNDNSTLLYFDARSIVNLLRLDKRHCSGIAADRHNQDRLFILIRPPATAYKRP